MICSKRLFLIFIPALVLFTAGIPARTQERVEFAAHTFSKTFYEDETAGPDTIPDDAPYLNVDLVYQEPVAWDDPVTLKKLQDFCLEIYFGGTNGSGIDDKLQQIALEALDDWKENGLSVLKDFPDATVAAMWEMHNAMSVEYNESGVLSIGNHFYQFSGGAHGISNSSFHVYDLNGRRPVTLDMLFTGDWYGALTYTINTVEKERHGLAPFDSLATAGFFVDDLEPTDNFFLTDEGITFYYNVYEVAPYVMGGIEVTVPYADIGAVLNTDGIIGSIIQNPRNP